MRNKQFLILFFLVLCIETSVFSQQKPAFLTNYDKEWVEKTFNSLSIEEKIGQLLMPRGNVSGKGYNPEKLKAWVKDYKIGGLVFFAGQPTLQSQIVNELQSISKVPLLIGMDLEWGLAMRLDSTVRFPYQMTLGAMTDNTEFIRMMGEEIGDQCKRMGVHISYSPVIDINSNPNNPVINFRSFGENKLDVTEKSLALMKGIQSKNVMTTAKHFPGHGDTGVDSHYDLPVVTHDLKRLNNVELYPYKKLVSEGLCGIMTAHLNIPALDTTKNLASTFSKNIVTNLIRNDLKFEGLVFTDAMDMQGAVKHFPEGQALVKAILAGNDILETFEDVPTAVDAIKKAIENKLISQQEIDFRVRKILMAKSWVGLNKYQPVQIQNLVADLNTTKSDYINRMFAESAVTLLKNENDLLPIKDLEQKIAVVSIDASAETVFQKTSKLYTNIDHFIVPINAPDSIVQFVHNKTKEYDILVIGLHLQNIRPYANFGINKFNVFALEALLEHKNSVVSIFGNPFGINQLKSLSKAKSIVMAYQLTDYMEDAAAQAIFGAIPFKGKLPISLIQDFKLNDGIATKSIGRLSYGVPEMVGINRSFLNAKIDSVITLGLKEKAYPGAVMQVAVKGRVIYKKSFGADTYDSYELKDNSQNYSKVQASEAMDAGKKIIQSPSNSVVEKSKLISLENKLYDLASITKISTSALALMQLESEGKFDLNKTFSEYLPSLKETNKADLRFIDMLTHRSGLKAWIPFWMDCIDTTATLKKALVLKPSLEKDFVKIYHKKNWIQKLFRTKDKFEYDYLGSILKDKSLWLKALSPNSITWKSNIFNTAESEDYKVQIADSLWLNKDYRKVIYRQIIDSPVNKKQGYVYSDLHYYFYPELISSLVQKPWEDYLKSTYRKLGANTLTYNPRRFYDLRQIVPTENDSLFRKTVIHGRVHDEGAGMLSGVSGHAGLFGTANDLMKLMQMYLQKGTYGGIRFIKPEVLEKYTDYQFASEKNRRAIAFDKLDFDKNIANGPQLGSQKSYGHSGFTGTFTWIDPEYQMVYVFLSNRVYPTRDNAKISTMNIRTEVGNQVYKAIKKEIHP